MMAGICKSCHRKNKLYKKYNTGHITKTEYNIYKNIFTQIFKFRKKQYHQNYINNHKNNASLI